VTRYADRKAKIRAFQATHPGMTYSQAARQVDVGAQLALPLPAIEQPSPFDALAASLTGLGQNDLAKRITTAQARWHRQVHEERALAQATKDAHDALINAPAGLSRAERHALTVAYELAEDAEDRVGLGDDSYEEVDLFLSTAFELLIRAASLADGSQALAQVAAEILDEQSLEFAADAIRGMAFHHAIPDPAKTPAAQHAQAAAETLVAAAAVRFGGDKEWTACMNLIKKAGELARAAADASTH
jgi:hypothetical protein